MGEHFKRNTNTQIQSYTQTMISRESSRDFERIKIDLLLANEMVNGWKH